MSDIILEMKNISMNFDGVHALNDVNFTLRKGEIHALVGENGAGKSTLMKILQGIYVPMKGEIILKGKKVNFKSPINALNNGISMIFQELNTIPGMTVAENMFMGKEPIKKVLGVNFVNHKMMYKEAQRLFEELDLDLNPWNHMYELSVARMQLAEIVKAISYNPDIIIMDEPTSALTTIEIEKLYRTMRLLQQRGITIIYISHKMDEIYNICDTFTVLRDGRFISTGRLSDHSVPKLVSMMVGRDIKEFFPKLKADIKEQLLELKNVKVEGVLDNINLVLHSGEILGLAGLMGAGRTEIAETIFGLRKMSEGEILIKGKPVIINSPVEAIQNKIALVPEDRKNFGLVLKMKISDNIILSRIKKCIRHILISNKMEKSEIDKLVTKIQIKTNNVHNLALSLSGGNQQKVVVAKAIFTDPEIIILDEPTRGIDVKTKAEIHLLISKMAQEGKGILMISSEMPEILGMSDRILVVGQGTIKGELLREEATQEKILKMAF